jgi:Spy/CpxP family protein refolding chaperone
MKKWILMACLCLLASSWAFADDGMGKCCMMRKMEKMNPEEKFCHKAAFILANADEISLNDEQIGKVRAITLKVKKNIVMKEAQIKTLALDIEDAVKEDDVDMKIINALVDKKFDLKKEKTKEALQGYVDLRGVLTKEQREQIKQASSKCMMMGRMKKMMMGPKDDISKGEKGGMEHMSMEKESD